MNRSHTRHESRRRWLVIGCFAAAAALGLAACSTTKTTTGASSSPSSATSPSATSSAAKAVTISTAALPGVGTVLVNGDGLTLYILSSEAGGKLTCTDASGCTKVWPDTELPSGQTAAVPGAGVQASLLGTVKSPDGHLYVTYAGFPLYTFAPDGKAGVAGGQGITSFGGTWSTIAASGTPVINAKSPSAGATTSPTTGAKTPTGSTATTPAATHSPSPTPSASPSGYGY